jgi:hypothetical protein
MCTVAPGVRAVHQLVSHLHNMPTNPHLPSTETSSPGKWLRKVTHLGGGGGKKSVRVCREMDKNASLSILLDAEVSVLIFHLF